MLNLRFIITLSILCIIVNISFAECPYAHTHIGINPTWRPDWSAPADAESAFDSDPTDNNKLWFFSVPPVHTAAPTPGWPQWVQSNGDVFLLLTRYLDGGQAVTKGDGSGKELWNCNFLYGNSDGYGDTNGIQHINGWHSAHGPQGKWNLESVDEQTEPAWDLYVRRQGCSLAEDDFFALDSNDRQVLTANGDTLHLEKMWLADFNAWGFHIHTGYYFWLEPDFNDTVEVTFSAYDAGGMYDPSGYLTLRFAKQVCVPLEGDLNKDCEVNLLDIAAIAGNWLQNGRYGD